MWSVFGMYVEEHGGPKSLTCDLKRSDVSNVSTVIGDLVTSNVQLRAHITEMWSNLGAK